MFLQGSADPKPDAVPEQYTTACFCTAQREEQPCRTHDKEESNIRMSSKQYTLRHTIKRNRATVKKVNSRKRKPDKDLNENIVARRTLELSSKEGEKKSWFRAYSASHLKHAAMHQSLPPKAALNPGRSRRSQSAARTGRTPRRSVR